MGHVHLGQLKSGMCEEMYWTFGERYDIDCASGHSVEWSRPIRRMVTLIYPILLTDEVCILT